MQLVCVVNYPQTRHLLPEMLRVAHLQPVTSRAQSLLNDFPPHSDALFEFLFEMLSCIHNQAVSCVPSLT